VIRAAAFAACALLTACAVSSSPNTPKAVQGYLSDAQLDALGASALPEQPELIGHAPYAEAPWASVEPGSDRWWLAIAHAELRPPEAAQHFDCALGTRLSARPRPVLTRMMSRLLADSDALARRVSAQGHVRRPIAVVQGLEPCQRIPDGMRESNSRPAGAAVVGAAYAELFAALAPDRAAEVRRTGREIGRSRAFCRMNWTRDIVEGADLGRAAYAEAAVAPGFAADLEAARTEVAAARAEGLTNPGCAAERRALAATPVGD
jgi:acid phosphatase (class A)